ncbi:MAG: DNA primase [Candidatus Bathyarchaeota archaeon]|nr:DNA primase [Candidatus Bathyarchaeota archaeon]
MAEFYLPAGMRPATLEERKEFYTSEFALEKVASWLQMRRGKTKFAVIIGIHTKIFPQAYREDADTTIIIDEYTNLEEIRAQVIEFLPEAVYYDRNVYLEDDRAEGQELAFDVDPENITCPIHGTLADKMKRHQGLSFCTIELELAKQQTRGLYEYLERQFSDLRVVYSGRGFHIHVLDQEAYSLTTKQRSELAETVKNRGFEVDAWVTAGEMRFIRLPYSLHGMVSRVALPLQKNEVEKFNPVTDTRCIPAFLRGKLTSL